jgi:succinate-acetate transporter protein
MAAPLPGDKAAGYTGLVVGALALLLALGAIVQLVNAKYAHEAPAAGAGAR